MIKLKNVVRDKGPDLSKFLPLTPEARKWLPMIPPEYWVRILEATERAKANTANDFPLEGEIHDPMMFINNSFNWAVDGLDSHLWLNLSNKLYETYREG
jgi:hypothetical protein